MSARPEGPARAKAEQTYRANARRVRAARATAARRERGGLVGWQAVGLRPASRPKPDATSFAASTKRK